MPDQDDDGDDQEHRDRELHLEVHLRRTDATSRIVVLLSFAAIGLVLAIIVLAIAAAS